MPLPGYRGDLPAVLPLATAADLLAALALAAAAGLLAALALAAAAGPPAAPPRPSIRPQVGGSGVRISKLAGTLAHDRVRAGFGVHTNIRGELVIHNLGSAMLKPVLCQGGCLR
jgi:hypothetical protein